MLSTHGILVIVILVSLGTHYIRSHIAGNLGECGFPIVVLVDVSYNPATQHS